MIEKTIETIVKELSPSAGDNLMGMDYDICHYFDSTAPLKFISCEQTDRNESMFMVHLEVTDSAEDIVSVTNSLLEAWNCLMYSYFEASSIEKYKEKAILRFVTVIDKDSFYITGKAIVSGKRYQELAKEYESKWGSVLPNA